MSSCIYFIFLKPSKISHTICTIPTLLLNLKEQNTLPKITWFWTKRYILHFQSILEIIQFWPWHPSIIKAALHLEAKPICLSKTKHHHLWLDEPLKLVPTSLHLEAGPIWCNKFFHLKRHDLTWPELSNWMHQK